MCLDKNVKAQKNMKYNYKINAEKRTIIVQTIGDLYTIEVANMGLKVLSKAKELKYKVFFDYRQSRNKISIGDAYNWFSEHYDRFDKELKFIPTAYITNSEDWDFFAFFECTSYNKGIPVKVFKEENAVWEWFKGL